MKNNLTSYIFFLLISFISLLAEGAQEVSISSTALSGIGNSIEVEDNKYDFMIANPSQPGRRFSGYLSYFDNESVKNYVLLKVDRYSLNYQSESYTAEVKVLITSYPLFSSTPVTQTRTLKVNYSTTSQYQDKHLIYISPSHYRMKVEITDIDFNSGFSGTFPVNLKLEAGIEAQRNYNIYGVLNLPSDLEIGHNDYSSSKGELEIYWDYVQGAESYELEWTYLDAYASDGRFKEPNEISAGIFLFANNATRVEVSANHYSIPLIYDKGYIVYRMRAKKIHENGKPMLSQWTFPFDNTTLNLIDTYFKIEDGHERDFNWQNTINFSEEGKNKSIISYSDGSLRKRQSVSKLNSQNESIVGEIIYDNEGRAVINVLPAPTGDDKIKYYPYFNLKDSSTSTNKIPYDKYEFDKDNSCTTPVNGMSTLDGASKYYSPQNTDKGGERAYLPDAEKKPFTQIEYTPDNTGRIKSQALAGSKLSNGSDHEIKYFYTTPTNDELDRLFGNEVGYSNHYKKRITRDPNGQVIIAYMDDKDNIIATSLSGENPKNLDKLSSNTGSADITDNLIDQDGQISKNKRIGNSLLLTENIFVAKEGDRNLEYTMEGQNFSKNCEVSSSSVCYNCVLDLHIYLTNDCGEKIELNSSDLKDYITTIGTVNTSGCTQIPEHFTNQLKALSLDPGTYTVTKELKINDAALNSYTQDYLTDFTCIKKEDDFINDELAGTVINCEVTCEQCRERVINKEQQYLGPNCDPCLTQEQYDQLLKDCDLSCATEPFDCKGALTAMLSDVSPFGQYGELLTLDADGKMIMDPSVFGLSIYNVTSSNKLPKKDEWSSETETISPTYKHPFNPEKTGEERYLYLNEDGTEALVEVVKVGEVLFAGFIIPVYEPFVENYSKVKENPAMPGKLGVNPKYLYYIKDFVEAWRPEWAASLVNYHPEYCYYEFCIGNKNSHQWDRDLLESKTFNEAVNQGLISNSQRPNPVSDAVGDPFFRSTNPFNNAIHVLANAAILNDLNNFVVNPQANLTYTIWQMAFVNTFCPQSGLANPLCPADASCPKQNSAVDFTSLGNNEELWKQFKILYLAAKKKAYHQRANYYAINHTCYNGCIGDSTFTAYKDNFVKFQKQVTMPWLWGEINYSFSEFYNSEQPCYKGTYDLYKGKMPRFPGVNDLVKGKDYTELCTMETEGLYKPYTCSANSEIIVNEIINQNNFQRYEECGQCPLARDLEFLLDAIVKRPFHELSTSQFNLTCFPGGYIEYTPLMADAMNFTGASQVVWKNLSMTNEQLVSEFRQVNGSACKISLAFKESHAGFIFDSIQSLCCLEYTTSPTQFTFVPGKNFLIKAKISNGFPIGSPERIVREFTLEGVTECLDIINCTAPVLCSTFGASFGLQSLLNTLVLNVNNPGFVKPNHLTSSNVNLELTPYKEFITPSFRSQGPIGSSWKWTGSAAGKILNGNISDELGNNCQIELTIPASANYTFSQIVRFTNIHVDESSNSPGSNFILNVIYKDSGGITKYAELRGFTSCIDIGSCRTAVINNQ